MRATFVTGMARIGSALRQVTIRHEDGRFFAATVGGAVIDPWTAQWATLRTVRNAAASKLHSDRRFSANGPHMFAMSANAITTRDGDVMGRWYSFDAFVEHMLVVAGDGIWQLGENSDWRVADAVEMLQQESWTN